jgi:hypothetical protein
VNVEALDEFFAKAEDVLTDWAPSDDAMVARVDDEGAELPVADSYYAQGFASMLRAGLDAPIDEALFMGSNAPNADEPIPGSFAAMVRAMERDLARMISESVMRRMYLGDERARGTVNLPVFYPQRFVIGAVPADEPEATVSQPAVIFDEACGWTTGITDAQWVECCIEPPPEITPRPCPASAPRTQHRPVRPARARRAPATKDGAMSDEQPEDNTLALIDAVKDWAETPRYPFRQSSAHGEPKPTTTIERTCRKCGASFLGLAAGRTGEVGIWQSDGRGGARSSASGAIRWRRDERPLHRRPAGRALRGRRERHPRLRSADPRDGRPRARRDDRDRAGDDGADGRRGRARWGGRMTTCQGCEGEADEAYLCGVCAWQLSKALGDIPGLLSDLRGVVVRQARVHRTIGAPREPDPDWRGGEHALIRTPWALRLDAADELERINNELVGWARSMPRAAGYGSRRSRGPGESAKGRAEPARAATTGRVSTSRASGSRTTARPWRTRRDDLHRRSFVQAPAIAQWLLGNLDAIRLDEAAGEILTEITQLRADLMRAVDNSPSPFYAGPCHAMTDEIVTSVRAGTVYVTTVRRRCELDLYAWVNPWDTERDDAKIVCRGRRSVEDGCGTVHTVADRQDWLLDSIEDALLPIEVWRLALPTMVDSLEWPHRSWWSLLADPSRPRRILPKTVIDGVEFFRGGDLLDWVEREQPRIKAARTREAVKRTMRKARV